MSREQEKQNTVSTQGGSPGDDRCGSEQPGVQIAHERPAPETEPHVIAPLIVALANGQRVTVRKWSLAGLRDKALAGADLTGARLCIPFQGIDVAFPVRLSPSTDGTLWAFDGLTGRQREALGLFYRNLLTGKMAATDEVITALDTPVDLIPMGETEEEKAAGLAKAKPKLLRIVLNVLWYVGLAVLLVGFLGNFVWSKMEGMTLSHARVYADRIELRAPGEGYLEIETAEPGTVAEGRLLAHLIAPETDLALDDAERRVALLQERIAEGRVRLDLHLSMRDEVRASVMRLYSETALVRFDAGIPLRPGDYNDQRSRLEQELRGFEADLDRATTDLWRLQQARRSLRILAPTEGLVTEWIAAPRQYMRAGDIVATFETDAPRVVRGWMDDRMAGSIRPGMEATITVPGTGEAQVLAGRVTDVEAGANPAAPDRFGIIVTVSASGLSVEESRNLMRFNAPIEVVVQRNLMNRWLGLDD
ncbi:MAG: HlyD family efflux transporter periplasmic adaptor subunit [Rubellimicrobium sp.]|nr:HlyD family efflux transporter periplasmic adaptor subunit [Rubellimicrobium sp.]